MPATKKYKIKSGSLTRTENGKRVRHGIGDEVSLTAQAAEVYGLANLERVKTPEPAPEPVPEPVKAPEPVKTPEPAKTPAPSAGPAGGPPKPAK